MASTKSSDIPYKSHPFFERKIIIPSYFGLYISHRLLLLFSNCDTKVSLNSAHLQALPCSVECGWSFTWSIIMATKRASYTVTFKLKVVEDRAAAMEYRVKEKQVRDCMETRKRTPWLLLFRVRLILEITWFLSQKRGVTYTPVRLITREIRYRI